MSSPNPISSWMKESFENFIAQISISKSKLTVEAYRYDVLKFLEYLTSKSVRRISSFKSDHIIGYLSYCKQDGKSDSSLNRYYMSIKSFVKFLRKKKLVKRDLIEDVPVPINRQVAPRVPTSEELNEIFEQPDTTTASGIRDRAILELLYSSGLRASELCDLKIEDVTATEVRVRSGKGGKIRTVPITTMAYNWVCEYLNHRGMHSGYLFLSEMGKQLWRQYLCERVSRYGKRAGVQGITTHSLRHACATHLTNEGADLLLVQQVLGHSCLTSTKKYTTLSTHRIQESFQKLHPRQKKEMD